MNALGCLSSENVFTSSSFQKDIFTGYRIRFFSFNTLKMLFYCLLASIVSNEKSIVIWISVPLCGMHCFLFCFGLVFGCLQKFFFIFGFQQFDYNVFGCGFCWVSPIWGSLNFSNLQVWLLQYLGSFWLFFLQIFFYNTLPSSSKTLKTQMSDILLLSHRNVGPVFFPSLFFLLFYWSSFKFTDSFLCYLHFLYSQSNKFFVLDIIFFSSKISSCFFFISSNSLLRLQSFHVLILLALTSWNHYNICFKVFIW